MRDLKFNFVYECCFRNTIDVGKEFQILVKESGAKIKNVAFHFEKKPGLAQQ